MPPKRSMFTHVNKRSADPADHMASPPASQARRSSIGANSCGICCEEYSVDGAHQPQMLKCGHTFCKECVDQLVKSHRHGLPSATCPTCRKETPASDLVKNYAVIKMLEADRARHDRERERRKKLQEQLDALKRQVAEEKIQRAQTCVCARVCVWHLLPPIDLFEYFIVDLERVHTEITPNLLRVQAQPMTDMFVSSLCVWGVGCGHSASRDGWGYRDLVAKVGARRSGGYVFLMCKNQYQFGVCLPDGDLK
ncbi:unnamed protein product [Vitrella brassicaformis CCMP3155]|uniref:RING-type domain-containing protein n=1 Tax=Vitrella brassicaformis (strain CCMP3155) TaxID=1169540 RepID=A0A0G4FSK5_VITBC|nr:unnamed protein product [Vitrella brassicaformis CCMP3155]|eukprot:CEM17697.1 unnamed protein product [Vitrella brassicaformis CCMP3155]